MNILSIFLAVVQGLTLLGVGHPRGGGGGGGATSPPTTNVVFLWDGTHSTCTSGCTGTNDITVLLDQSGASNNATSSGTNGTYIASAINGKPGITVAGGSAYNFPGSGIAIPAAATVCLVVKNTAGTKGMIASGAATSLGYYSGSTPQQGADSTVTANLGNGTAALDTAHYISQCMDVNVGAMHFWLAGGADGTGLGAGGFAQPLVGLFANFSSGSERLGGVVVAIGIYTSVLSSGDRAQWFAYTLSVFGV